MTAAVFLIGTVSWIGCCSPAAAADTMAKNPAKAGLKTVPLFDGKKLDGWIQVPGDPAAGQKGPIAWQMQNATLFDEYKDVEIEVEPRLDELVTTQ